MNYHQYYPVDIVNGPGTRCTLFVSGCVHECPGCYNKSTWRVNSGQPFTAEMADRIIADLNDTRVKRQGISLSGGDPLHPQNVPEILKLVQRIHAECPGCYNKSTWRLNSGMPFTAEMEDKIINDLNDTRIKRQGISLSGGDPLHPQNVPAILKLVKRIRRECAGKDVWVWTGYKLDELNAQQMEVVDLINVLVDGKFVQDLKDPMLIWRGSSNQVVHHLR